MTQKNRLYPHLLKEDIELWEEWLGDHAKEYTSFDYDVRVGTGRDPGPNYNESLRRMGIGLSQRRIDVVGFAANHLAIIEITLRAGMKAVGQLTVYPLLYIETYGSPKPLKKIIVCRTMSPDIKTTVLTHDIFVHRYPKPPVI